jgi:hypothetical protein
LADGHGGDDANLKRSGTSPAQGKTAVEAIQQLFGLLVGPGALPASGSALSRRDMQQEGHWQHRHLAAD